MTAQSREPETGRSARQCRTGDTAKIPGGLKLGGKRPEGQWKPSNPQGGETDGPTGVSPSKNGTTEQNG